MIWEIISLPILQKVLKLRDNTGRKAYSGEETTDQVQILPVPWMDQKLRIFGHTGDSLKILGM